MPDVLVRYPGGNEETVSAGKAVEIFSEALRRGEYADTWENHGRAKCHHKEREVEFELGAPLAELFRLMLMLHKKLEPGDRHFWEHVADYHAHHSWLPGRNEGLRYQVSLVLMAAGVYHPDAFYNRNLQSVLCAALDYIDSGGPDIINNFYDLLKKWS